jgi:hypothetical protein
MSDFVTTFKISFGSSKSVGPRYVVASIAMKRLVKIEPTNIKTEMRTQNCLFRF